MLPEGTMIGGGEKMATGRRVSNTHMPMVELLEAYEEDTKKPSLRAVCDEAGAGIGSLIQDQKQNSSLMVPGDTFRYIIVALVSASLVAYFAHRQGPSYKLARVEDALKTAEESLESAKANCTRSHVELMDLASRLLEAKLSASNIRTRLLKARNVTDWREYLKKIGAIMQSIKQCFKDVKEIQTSTLLTIEAEREHEFSEDLRESRDILDAVISSATRHVRAATRRFESASNANASNASYM
ncbi:hypothetical protein B0H19DRAFT_1071829 [Mycena capillaripes]|nr:hypothetical protein B0H19DRAFT_1071829 [Mycena capillaripes]